VIRAAHVLYWVGLSVWVGGLSTLSFVVAPLVFRNAPSRSAAGAIFGAVLRGFGFVEMVCAALVVAASVVLHKGEPRESPLEVARLALVAIMVALLFSYVLGVNPAIAAERDRIARFDSLPEGDPAKERFDRLHRWSVRLVGANLLAGWALLILSAATLKTLR
jgi:uncharacterized membrane protein